VGGGDVDGPQEVRWKEVRKVDANVQVEVGVDISVS
jgi:hypothetical protein